MSYETKYHRDGTVTVWDVYAQQWIRSPAREIYRNDQIMASLNQSERARIEAMAYGRTMSEANALARKIIRLADDGGTLQAEDMLRVTSDPKMHSACLMDDALRHCHVYHAAEAIRYAMA